MIGAYEAYAGAKEAETDTHKTGLARPHRQQSSDPRKALSRQLCWKFFGQDCSPYQIEAVVRPIPASASHLVKEQQTGHILEVLLNGVRVFAGATPSFSRPQDHSFAITAKELPDLQDHTVHLKLEEDNKSRLSGTAKLGKRSLQSPEYFTGDGSEGLRRLTWRFVFKGFCFYLSYTVSQRFAVSQLAVNGYPVCQKKHGMFQQLQFKKQKYEFVVNERGLGVLHGQRLILNAELLKNDIIEAVAKVGDQTLPPPRYFRGDARKVLPMMQATEADLQLRTGSIQDMCVEELLGDAPQGWVSPISALKLQQRRKEASRSTSLRSPSASSSTSSDASGSFPTAAYKPSMHPQLQGERSAGRREAAAAASASAPEPLQPTFQRATSSARSLPGGLEPVPEGTHSMEMGKAGSIDSSAFRTELQAFEQPASEHGTAIAGMDSGFCTTDSEMLSDFEGTADMGLAQGSEQRSSGNGQNGYDSSPVRPATGASREFGRATADRQDSLLSEASSELQRMSLDDEQDNNRRHHTDFSGTQSSTFEGIGDKLLSTPSQSQESTPRSRSKGFFVNHSQDGQEGFRSPVRAASRNGEAGGHIHGGSTPDGQRSSFASSCMDIQDAAPGSLLGGSSDPSPNTTSELGFSLGFSPGRSSTNAEGMAPSRVLEMQKNADPAHWCMNRNDVQILKTSSGKKLRIGEGSSGTVYKAMMHGCDEVAVKLVKAQVPTEKERENFYREVLMLHAIRHKNIVQFYGACLEPDCYFIVTELMAGGDMYSALRRCPELMAWGHMGRRIAIDVALGLNYLHSRRPAWMHRDLKSPNVLLTREGVAKIGDVGLMRAQVNPSMTAQNSWTPLWAAPEVICHERASIKADIWSFGIIVWELISQQNIADFPALGMSCQMKNAAHMLRLPRMCPSNAARVFYECTKIKPEERPDALTLVEWLREE
ncbi:hypothetical protein WJX73_008655 [Symbiochloris irregularis]|uniref:Protein kinase domain-containing protein n=1 Tax=Symbiochloris irregularis TaxID=706552 RepID=A0AAW1NS98_9CHLO